MRSPTDAAPEGMAADERAGRRHGGAGRRAPVMNSGSAVQRLVWPRDRLGELAAQLVAVLGWGPAVAAAEGPSPDSQDGLAEWMTRWSARHKLQAQPVFSSYAELDGCLERVGPAVVALRTGFLAVLKGGRGRIRCLAPDGSVESVHTELLADCLGDGRRADLPAASAGWLEEGIIAPARRKAAQDAIAREHLAQFRVEVGWLLRPSPGASLRLQFREANGPAVAMTALGAQFLTELILVTSWLAIGNFTRPGHFQWTWMDGWSLLLLTMVPLQAASMRAETILVVKLGAIFKRRLLYGLLNYDSDASRKLGSGQLMSMVLETSILELVSLAGGLFSVLTGLRLVMALLILVVAGKGLVVACAMLAWLAAVALLIRRLWRQTRDGMEVHRLRTNDLLEKMVGHRTYVAQLDPGDRHKDEDVLLWRHWFVGLALDGNMVVLISALSRGWLIVGSLALIATEFFFSLDSTSFSLIILSIFLAHQSLSALSLAASELVSMGIAWRQLAPILESAQASRPDLPRQEAPPPRAEPAPAPPLLRASDLGFSHGAGTRPVLRDIDLSIRHGDRVLLQGASGGGKSTLAAILAGARAASSGDILLEGQPLSALGRDAWRKRIVNVPQFHENHIFCGTMAFNLLLGRRWPPLPDDIEQAAAVCRELNLGPLLDQMPAGMQQMIGESGWALSHGERSRVFIARALLQDPDLIILDESLSALDPQTTAQSFECVLRRAKSLILIAHP